MKMNQNAQDIDYNKKWPDLNVSTRNEIFKPLHGYNNTVFPLNKKRFHAMDKEKKVLNPSFSTNVDVKRNIQYDIDCQHSSSTSNNQAFSSIQHSDIQGLRTNVSNTDKVLHHGNCNNSFRLDCREKNANHDNLNPGLLQTVSNETQVLSTDSSSKKCNIPQPLQKLTVTPQEDLRVTLSRDEIVSRRRVKVAARRQMKKMEKQQLKEIVIGVQAAKPDFCLEQLADDFPTLNDVRSIKTIKSNESTLKVKSDLGKITAVEDSRPINIVEKSWKPKTKDPIYFNIDQALQNKPEKSKLIKKKVDPTSMPNIQVGNILDSDNPTQKKGKVRPDKVRKPSKLKEKILSERKERQKKRLDETQTDNCKPTDNSDTNIEESIQFLYTGFNDELSILLESCVFIEANPKEKPNIKSQSSDDQKNVEDSKISKSIHSRKFRDYCTNCLTDDITTSTCALLEKVAYFQDRTFARDPIRANAKRRYVAGINQTKKYLHLKKVRLLVIAPNLEKNSVEGGLDEKISHLKKEADSQGVPCVFGPNRKRLGKAVFKNTLVSCVAVFSYEGAEEQFTKVLEALQEAKSKYQSLISHVQEESTKEQQQNPDPPVEQSCISPDVTSSLLATLKAEMLQSNDTSMSPLVTTELAQSSPTDTLLQALHRHSAW